MICIFNKCKNMRHFYHNDMDLKSSLSTTSNSQSSNAIGRFSSTVLKPKIKYNGVYSKPNHHPMAMHSIQNTNIPRTLSINTVMSIIRNIPEVNEFVKKYNFGVNFNKRENELLIGDLYTLRGVECDDFKMPIKVYKLVAVLHELNGVELNSVVVKQVGGEETTIFSLTKFDCETLSLPFEKGLQIFPKTMNWVVYKEETEEEADNRLKKADLNNLSTYPKSPQDGNIWNIVIKLEGFSSYRKTHIVIPSGDIIKTEDLHNMLKVRTIIPIESFNHTASFECGEEIPYVIATSSVTNNTYSPNCPADLDENLYLELQLAKPYRNLRNISDALIGVSPIALNDKSTEMLFEVIIEDVKKETRENNEIFNLIMSSNYSGTSSLYAKSNTAYETLRQQNENDRQQYRSAEMEYFKI